MIWVQLLKSFARLVLISMMALCSLGVAGASSIELVVDASRAGGEIDLTRYALGQGGLSEEPMFDSHVKPIAQLRPQTIRVFIQEYFNLYPDHGRYHWETFDTFMETILATGAKPILSLCFKPPVLFPKIDQRIVHPNNYEEWEELIFRMVKHCNEEKRFGIEYWEVGNEPDIGEDGGCPYLFQKEDYVTYYKRTAAAIRRADPRAKIGGPALAWYKSEIADALIEHCGSSDTPLDFFSWHIYNSDPEFFRKTIREVKAKLGKFPKLKQCETIIDEWNMTLDKPNLDPGFQPAFILQTTLVFHEEGLSRSAYYHIRDYYVNEAVFAKSILSRPGAAFMARWWNTMPQYDGLWDHHGRVRPAYFAFKLLSLIRGRQIPVQGRAEDLHAIAAKDDHSLNLVVWNFPAAARGVSRAVTLKFPATEGGVFRQIHLDPRAKQNELEIRRHGAVAELADRPIQMTLQPYEICWITIGR